MPSHQTTTRTQPKNIHIDRLRVIGLCHHHPLGTVVPLGGWSYAFPVKGPEYYIKSRQITGAEARAIELHVCPPQLLQGHNTFGHGDLIDYAVKCLHAAIRQENIQLYSDPTNTWRAGRFKVTEVHLTGNFGLLRDYVIPAIDSVDANITHGKHRDERTSLTVGYNGSRRSRYRALTLYYKWLLLKKRWATPGPLQQKVLDYLENSIRAELKLYSMQLKRLGLNEGWMWQGRDVAELFFAGVARFNIAHSVQRSLTDHELSELPLKARNAYLLWLKGVSIFDQFKSRSTAWAYIHLIKEVAGIDCSGNRRPEELPAFDFQEVLAPENLLPVPDFLLNTPYYAAPGL